MKGRVRALAALSPLCLVGAAPLGGVLHVDVANVRAATGRVHVDICTQEEFLKDCRFAADAPAKIGVTRVTVPALPPGRYAAQVYFDENGNGKVDRALFGVPKEGVGFSNDAKIVLGPPKFADAVFPFEGGMATIELKLRYFIGGDTPR